MDKKLTRRSFFKKVISYSITGVLTTTLGYSYARYFEPKQLDILKKEIAHPLIPKGFNGAKIIQFSDTHLGFSYSLSQLERLVANLNGFSPDIVIFTGDLIDKPHQYKKAKSIIPILKNIEAPLGKLAIFGNHDHGGNGTNIYRSIMEAAGFRILQNESVRIKLIDNSQIIIAGIDDCILGKPSIQQALPKQSNTTYTILLAHEPDIATEAAEYNIHLQISGHSHGGQIKIPLYGPLYTPPLGEKYFEGLYVVGKNKMQLYVNRGLGTTRLPLRFLSKPELTIFTLRAT